jgi:hypothetical protein
MQGPSAASNRAKVRENETEVLGFPGSRLAYLGAQFQFRLRNALLGEWAAGEGSKPLGRVIGHRKLGR